MIQETWVQFQVTSYQRLEKWYLIPSCLTLNNIRYVSRRKWSNPGNGVAPSPLPRCSSCWKWNLWVALNYGRQLYLLIFGWEENVFLPFFSSYMWKHVQYPALISCQPGVITVSVAQGGTATPGATKQLLLPDRVFKRIIYIYIYIYIYTHTHTHQIN